MTPDRWSVVEQCGYTDEHEVFDDTTFNACQEFVAYQYTAFEVEEMHVAILKNGTTEY